MKKQNQNIILAAQIATIGVFFGRVYQHLFWDAPFRSLFWDANLMSGLVETFSNYTWREYVTSPQIDTNIQTAIFVSGILYLICGIIAIFIKKVPKHIAKILWIGAASLIFLALLYMKEKFLHVGQFLEYTLQFSSPIILYLLVFRKDLPERFWFFVKIAVALTFTCHGLYAIGYYPRPELFMTMTMNILGVGNETAILLMKMMGIMDFVVSIGIFLNFKIARYCWVYVILWGLATSLARIFGNFYFEFWQETFHQWTHEMVMRFPHFMIPIAAFLYYQNKWKRKK